MRDKSEAIEAGFRMSLAGRVATLTLDRPPLNILNITTCRALHAALQDLAARDEVGVLVVAGAGKAFCAGVDVAEHEASLAPIMLQAFHAFCRALLDFPRPTIARVHGPALGGGCEVALCCDLAVSGASAKVGLPEITLGLFPPVAAVLLPRLAGRRAAAEAILWGDALPAASALRLGLVSEVVPDDRLDARVTERAGRAAQLSGSALRLAREALRRGAEGPPEAALQRVERVYLEDLMRTRDAGEGLKAFLEKRPPIWSQR